MHAAKNQENIQYRLEDSSKPDIFYHSFTPVLG
jgi:hypothetical protein